MKNPFVTSGYAGQEYFCDRVEETLNLRTLLQNENNVALISPRRLGKTELISHVFDCDEMRNDYYCFVIDIYATKSLDDFVNVLGKAVLDTLKPKGKATWNSFLLALSSIRTGITYDAMGVPSWSLGLGEMRNPSVTLNEIFSYLQNADRPCIVAIDEFQQITKYGDTNVEAVLRSHVQRTTNAHFIFSGSHRHLMGEIFISPSRPFYQSVSLMNLKPLPLDKYTEFAIQKFSERGRSIEPEVVENLYVRFSGVTSYIHRVLNILFSRTPEGGKCDLSMVEDAIEFVVRLSSDSYESLFYQMPIKQRNVFLAIASENHATEITGSGFLKAHGLPSASSVASAAKGLLDKDFVTNDNGQWSVYDQFFVLWLKSKGMI